MNPTTRNEEHMTSNLPEPATESLGAAIIELDRARLPRLAAWLLRDGTRARSIVADEVARRVESRVVARVREETTARINASWEKALTEQAEAEQAAEPLPPFNSITQCRKCGNVTDPAIRTKSYRWPVNGEPESMQRRCEMCGFSWLEAPADAEALSGPQSDGNEHGDRMDPEGADGPSVALPDGFPGHSSAERPEDAHSAAETRQGAPAASESPNHAQDATEASQGRLEGNAPQSVGGDDA